MTSIVKINGKKKRVKFWDELTPKQKVIRWASAVRCIENLTPHERKHHFDMGDWIQETECGTVGCAAGHCGLDPNIRKQGFAWQWKKEIFNSFFSIDPRDFYGDDATDSIFLGPESEYKHVLKEMKLYLKKLQNEV